MHLEPAKGEKSSGALARSKQEPPVSGRGDGDGSVKFTGQADNGNSEETSAMPLLQSIGELFSTDFSDSLERFHVPDSGTDRGGLRVVLLVESPNTHEVWYRYPLAGHLS